MTFWAWLTQNGIALIGHGLTLLAIILSVATVIWQLGRQHKSSLLIEKNNSKEQLKLQIHRILIQKIRILSKAINDATIYAIMVRSNLEVYQLQIERGWKPAPVKERATEFLHKNSQVTKTLIELLEEFEAWEIAFPGIEIFQSALNSANYDAQQAFRELFEILLLVLPMDTTVDANSHNPSISAPSPISKEVFDQLNTSVTQYENTMHEIASYVCDLTIESQNNLLSNLFDHRVPLRKPLDPNLKVITTSPPEKAEQLLHYFKDETAWGNSIRDTEIDVIVNLEQQ